MERCPSGHCRPYKRAQDRVLSRLRTTGWTPEAFDAAWKRQRGRCAICGTRMVRGTRAGNGVAADHDHRTRTTRALLCALCNVALGALRDDPSLMRAAAAYVERHAAA